MFYVEGIQYSVCTLGRRIAGRVTDVLRQKERRQHVSKEIKQKVIISELDLKGWLFFSIPVLNSEVWVRTQAKPGHFLFIAWRRGRGKGSRSHRFQGELREISRCHQRKLTLSLCNRLVLKDAFLPPHLYGQLVQKKNGFKLLQKSVSVIFICFFSK